MHACLNRRLFSDPTVYCEFLKCPESKRMFVCAESSVFHPNVYSIKWSSTVKSDNTRKCILLKFGGYFPTLKRIDSIFGWGFSPPPGSKIKTLYVRWLKSGDIVYSCAGNNTQNFGNGLGFFTAYGSHKCEQSALNGEG